MQSTKALREKAMQLLAADTATLAQASDANVMCLLMASISPGEGLQFADLVLATFDGSTPLECGLGSQPEGLDPLNDDSMITLEAPAGGWRWETSGVTNLPQTIYGYALLNDALDDFFGADLLPAPITLNAVNQVITLPPVGFKLAAGTIQ